MNKHGIAEKAERKGPIKIVHSFINDAEITAPQGSTKRLTNREARVKMKKFVTLFNALALLVCLCACKSTAARWQEQYDLGVRYLSDGEYEEAIIAFNAAIEIDPMQADAYLNLANAYIGMNNFDAAREILQRGYELTQSEALKSKLEELDSGNIFDFWGNPRKRSGYDGEGNLKWFHIYEYNKKQMLSVTTYDAAGNQTGYWDGFRYDEKGKELTSMHYCMENGLVYGPVELIYDEQGRVTRTNAFDLDGSLQQYATHEYDDAGKLIRINYYNAEGELNSKTEYAYDGDLCTGYTNFDENGSMAHRSEYSFDEQGKVIGEIAYGPDGEILWEQASEH